MRDAEIERLLGGYATNTLNEAERQALFTAALDDQELFNALEDEQALRELLEDGASRRIIGAALVAREPVRPAHWFARPWAWGGLVAAAAGLAITFVLLMPRPEAAQKKAVIARLDQPVMEPRADTPLEKPPATRAPKQQKQLGRISDKVTVPPTPAIQAETAQVQPAAPPVDAPNPAPVSPPMAVVNGFRAGYEARQLRQAATGIGYTVLRRGPGESFVPVSVTENLNAGDFVKLRVEVPVSGSLQILEQNAGGEWTPLYPADGGLAVIARQQYTIPGAPIPLGLGKHLRLVLTSAPPVANVLATGAMQALARPKERYAAESSSVTGGAKPSVVAPAAKSDASLTPGVYTTDIILTPRRP